MCVLVHRKNVSSPQGLPKICQIFFGYVLRFWLPWRYPGVRIAECDQRARRLV
jgi:hypothetical protein